MALPVLDGNQSATTLSSVVTGGEHIVAHSVVCLGSTAIANITNAVSGSVVSVSNFPSTQTVAGTVSISNFPSTQTIAGTVTANLSSSNLNSVTIGVRGSVTANSNLTATALVDLVEPVRAGVFSWADGELQGIISNSTPVISGTVTVGASSVTFNANVGTRSDGSRHPLSLESGSNYVNARVFSPSVEIFQATVTVGNSVTIGSLPAISGTVTANLFGEAVGGGPNEPTKLQCDSNGFLITSLYRSGSDAVNYDPVAGNVSVNVKNVSSVTIGSLPAISGTVTVGNTVAISGTVTANPTGTQTVAGTVTVSAISTSVTARLVDGSGTAVSYAATGTAGSPSSDVISVQGVSGGTSLPISGTAGSLTTRFGSVTTAGTAQISSAVTNASRKYLLVQNVTTSSNVITIGIGFTPTTTQGIQLTAGAGITFESSYIPTGAVYVLSSVTASPFTILEA